MYATRSLIRRAAAAATAVTAALVLAACGQASDTAGSGHGAGHGGSATPSASAGSAAAHNAADTAFAQGMVPHHRQALEMASLAATRAESAEVKTLADEIRKAQDPEITTLSGWLATWGEQAQGGHAGHSMSGMMTGEEMEQLGQKSGRAFDTAFLQLMVKHHEGAVAMARTEQTDGAYQPAKDMAASVIASQSAEITRMNGLLGTR
ncbi:DUF305 domain-containing protein [Streptomyces sp. NPDC001272]|uniref:DUF305 domain-containing protein n=1 Tax=unclassified Streptomyces TaxID=2593676 RepID=UPI0033AC1CF0